MKTYDSDKPLVSIHIPKCAGSSFLDVLASWFGKGLYQHYHDEKRNRPPKKHSLYTGLFEKRFKRGICIHGHFNNARGNGVRDYYPELDQFITIIRDPFDMHISNYFYVKQLAQNGEAYRSGKQLVATKKDGGLEAYLDEQKKSYICQFLPADITLDNYQRILEEQFVFVGITENFQDSVNILAKKLGFPEMQVPVSNVSAWNEKIPDGARDEFIRNNLLEMAIYDYAKNKFEQTLLQLNAEKTP